MVDHENQFRAMLVTKGPVVVHIDARSLKHSKGHFRGKCGKRARQAVLLVGWNQYSWIIKNSWSDKWGDKGYLYLKRGENLCNIQHAIGIPFLFNHH